MFVIMAAAASGLGLPWIRLHQASLWLKEESASRIRARPGTPAAQQGPAQNEPPTLPHSWLLTAWYTISGGTGTVGVASGRGWTGTGAPGALC